VSYRPYMDEASLLPEKNRDQTPRFRRCIQNDCTILIRECK